VSARGASNVTHTVTSDFPHRYPPCSLRLHTSFRITAASQCSTTFHQRRLLITSAECNDALFPHFVKYDSTQLCNMPAIACTLSRPDPVNLCLIEYRERLAKPLWRPVRTHLLGSYTYEVFPSPFAMLVTCRGITCCCPASPNLSQLDFRCWTLPPNRHISLRTDEPANRTGSAETKPLSGLPKLLFQGS
jgi:hypothetical protein